MSGYYVIEPCASANGVEIKLQGKRIDLARAEKALSKGGEIIASMPVVVVARIGAYSISAYASGRIMVKAAKKPKAEEVNRLAEKLMKSLEKGGAVI